MPAVKQTDSLGVDKAKRTDRKRKAAREENGKGGKRERVEVEGVEVCSLVYRSLPQLRIFARVYIWKVVKQLQ